MIVTRTYSPLEIIHVDTRMIRHVILSATLNKIEHFAETITYAEALHEIRRIAVTPLQITKRNISRLVRARRFTNDVPSAKHVALDDKI